jgi:hypothetical protein
LPYRGWRKNDYSNINFSRRFHPPCRDGTIVSADYDDIEKLITIYLPSFRYFGYTSDSKVIKEIVRLFLHESLHGVILAIQWSDRVPEMEIGDAEWPMENGMDPFATKLRKNIAKKHYHKHK